jgi:tetratricopeptide (TPR) repeat protein
MGIPMKHLVSFVAAVLALSAPGVAGAAPQDDLSEGWSLKKDGRLDEAAAAFERARAAGASPQLIEMELGYLSALRGDAKAARVHFTHAMGGDDAELARRAQAEIAALAQPAEPAPAPPPPTEPPPPPPPPATSALDEGYRAKAKGDLAAARTAFERARANPTQAQIASMELGYLAASAGDPDTARARFDEAAIGANADLGAQARRERNTLPRHVFGDAYFDAYGWDRRAGATTSDPIVVPTLRMRAFLRPVLSIPVDAYAAAQVVRDTASRGFVGLALPKVYADNFATFGAGLRAKLWRRLELFAQIGPAINLLDDGRDRTALDVRGGALMYAETRDCGPPPEHGVRARFLPCGEVYAEGIYASRFNNDVMAYARPRAAAGYLVMGPVLWQIVAEGRAGKDLNNDYWNNFADAGIGPRWRLLAPFRFDLLFTASAGAYFGLANRDPAPSRLTYGDLRVLASTYLEL